MPRSHESIEQPPSTGERLVHEYQTLRAIGDPGAARSLMRVVENARNEYVKHARNIPKDLPESDKLIDYLRPELQKIFAETKDPAQAYLKVSAAFDHAIDKFKAEQQRKAA